MKIVQVLFSGLGGHGSVAFSLVRGDRQHVHRHAMIFYGIERLASGYDQACTDMGISYDVVYKRPGLDLRSWADFIGALKRGAPDVVLLHSTSLVVPASVYARLAGVPLVVVDHLSNQVKQRRDWQFTSLALALADRTVFLTEGFAAEIQARLGRLYAPDRVKIIGNGIDVAAFGLATPRPLRATGSIRVGMHARFSASKDHVTLLRAIARLRDVATASGHPAVTLSLAGDGETLAATQRLAHDLAIDHLVEFPGLLPESALPDYLRSLDIYALSSRGETMSTGLMQAMAAGLPVVASRIPGLQTMVREGETGDFFDLGDDKTLAELLHKLAGDPARRAQLGRAALDHAQRHWSQETMFSAYESLLLPLSNHGAQPERRRFGGPLARLGRILRPRD